jgi:hypothetical protein
MEFRKSTEQDNPAIVKLLKSALGETSSPKNLNYWIWKHEKNPFGKSEVMVSVSEESLSGLRAMMPWVWQAEQHQYKTYRAVDTATHPDFQGKGIFKKLTQNMVGQLQAVGSDFIFNTPNSQSLPGYLKMGWQEWGRIKVSIIPYFLIHFLSSNASNQGIGIDETQLLCSQWNEMQSKTNKLFTPKSPAYLKWRYIDNPVIAYHCHADQDFFVAAYIKNHKKFVELRISELICVQNNPKIKSRFLGFLKTLAKDNKVHFITLSEQACRNLHLPGLSLTVGPVLTTRKLSLQTEVPHIQRWSPALGDLELF